MNIVSIAVEHLKHKHNVLVTEHACRPSVTSQCLYYTVSTTACVLQNGLQT